MNILKAAEPQGCVWVHEAGECNGATEQNVGTAACSKSSSVTTSAY